MKCKQNYNRWTSLGLNETGLNLISSNGFGQNTDLTHLKSILSMHVVFIINLLDFVLFLPKH